MPRREQNWLAGQDFPPHRQERCGAKSATEAWGASMGGPSLRLFPGVRGKTLFSNLETCST